MHGAATLEFVNNNWFAIISFLVALIGGVPGIITVINQRKNRAIFRFKLENFIRGQSFTPSGEAQTMVFLTGTASNEGNAVLTPAYFELECKAEGKWIKFEKRLIPEGLQLQSDHQQIQLEAPWKKDLQRYSGTITTGMPLNGHLMFVSPTAPFEKIRDNLNLLEFKLTCRDIFEKKYIMPIEPGTNVINAPTIHPKHGLTVTPKT